MHGGGVRGGEAYVVGACMGEGGVHAMHTLPARYYEIRSMNGRCASYWNAFLFSLFWFFLSLMS